MNRTKIEWCGHTWNPVTGCRHECPYCYAQDIAWRFRTQWERNKAWEYRNLLIDSGEIVRFSEKCPPSFGTTEGYRWNWERTHYLWELPEPLAAKGRQPFPFGFEPTFHRYRLDEPAALKKPSNVFVCSMADLFGDWVPLRWIRDVFDACAAAPQHRYLFLTKNPARYDELETLALLPTGERFWYGATVTKTADFGKIPMQAPWYNQFLSVEPLLERVDMNRVRGCQKWIIVGAETGNRQGKVVPERAWVDEITEYCKAVDTPIFYKNSLRKLFPDLPESRFPWE